MLFSDGMECLASYAVLRAFASLWQGKPAMLAGAAAHVDCAASSLRLGLDIEIYRVSAVM